MNIYSFMTYWFSLENSKNQLVVKTPVLKQID